MIWYKTKSKSQAPPICNDLWFLKWHKGTGRLCFLWCIKDGWKKCVSQVIRLYYHENKKGKKKVGCIKGSIITVSVHTLLLLFQFQFEQYYFMKCCSRRHLQLLLSKKKQLQHSEPNLWLMSMSSSLMNTNRTRTNTHSDTDAHTKLIHSFHLRENFVHLHEWSPFG